MLHDAHFSWVCCGAGYEIVDRSDYSKQVYNEGDGWAKMPVESNLNSYNALMGHIGQYWSTAQSQKWVEETVTTIDGVYYTFDSDGIHWRYLFSEGEITSTSVNNDEVSIKAVIPWYFWYNEDKRIDDDFTATLVYENGKWVVQELSI
ncbi:MAG: hypothetical protein ATN35_08815 [Epulopiscium sp. Nele67-Bin004]|nr:MAG: hypothetical protein ATN35_08815 [Epulopiscium sp. Nele67-Bin004]